MKAYVKEFFSEKDTLITSLFFLTAAGITSPSLSEGAIWSAIFLGSFFYILTEYLTHRFFFHMKPPKNPTMLKFMKRIHYDHHLSPKELTLLFLPIWYSLPNVGAAGVIVYFIVGDFSLTIAFLTGVLGTLLYYEWTHFVAHRPIKPLTPWGKWMKKVHLWHHYKNENYWFGVTNPIFDVAMGTFKDEKDVEKSETARNLEA